VSSRSEARQERRLCCAVSEASGEDPAGTGTPFAGYLGIEVPLPWKRDVTESRHFLQALREAVERAQSAGLIGKFTGLVPDPEYSREGHVRVILLRRPPGLFAAYEKEEYVAPEGEVVALVETLAAEPDALSRFARYREDTSHIRDILVCTHGSRDVCCGRFGHSIYQRLRHDYAAEGRLRVWRTSHLGGHRFAPHLLDLPEGRYWCRLVPEILENLVLRNGPVSDLRRFYRGWAGLHSSFEQIAEREAFMREGWKWTEYSKAGEVLEVGENGDRAEVRIEYRTPSSFLGAYEATVEADGSVMTLLNSGTGSLQEARQYVVNRLQKVPPRSRQSHHHKADRAAG
jgi:hypothetical protein